MLHEKLQKVPQFTFDLAKPFPDQKIPKHLYLICYRWIQQSLFSRLVLLKYICTFFISFLPVIKYRCQHIFLILWKHTASFWSRPNLKSQFVTSSFQTPLFSIFLLCHNRFLIKTHRDPFLLRSWFGNHLQNKKDTVLRLPVHPAYRAPGNHVLL